MDPAHVAAIEKAVEVALKDPELVTKSNDIGMPLKYMNSKDYGEYLQRYDREIAAIWKTSPWK
jgi:hypothetical protein